MIGGGVSLNYDEQVMLGYTKIKRESLFDLEIIFAFLNLGFKLNPKYIDRCIYKKRYIVI
jgi:hypothetical protein